MGPHLLLNACIEFLWVKVYSSGAYLAFSNAFLTYLPEKKGQKSLVPLALRHFFNFLCMVKT